MFGLEMHLVRMHRAIEEFAPEAVVIDPISSLMTSGTPHEVKSMLVRLFDYLKNRQITCLATSLTSGSGIEETEIGISSLTDTWFQVRDIEISGERTRGLYLVKSRGMGHSNQIREFLITPAGIDLLPVAIGPTGILTGSARLNLELEQQAQSIANRQERDRKQAQLERKRKAFEAQIEAMRGELATEEEEVRADVSATLDREQRLTDAHARLSQARSNTRRAKELR